MARINLKVQIEMNGQFVQAGHITGSSFRDAAFSYDESYINVQKFTKVVLMKCQ